MDLEEKKSEDLFGIEPKQEVDDFLVVPKLEEVIDPCSSSTLTLPTRATLPTEPSRIVSIGKKRRYRYFQPDDDGKQNIIQKLEPQSQLPQPQKLELLNLNMPTLNKNSISKQRLAYIDKHYGFPRNKDLDHTQWNRKVVRKCQTEYFCSVCSRFQDRQYVQYNPLKTDRLIILVGCILRGDVTLHQAQKIIFAGIDDRDAKICRVHLHESFKAICNALNITNPNNIPSCSLKSVIKLMLTFNKLAPSKITPWNICNELKAFARRRNLLGEIPFSTQMELEDQNLECSTEQEIKQITEDVLENIKEEPLDEEHFEQTMPKLELFPDTCESSWMEFKNQKSDNRFQNEIKKETEDCFENVKAEPIDDEYFEQTMPKLEAFDEPRLPSISYVPTQ